MIDGGYWKASTLFCCKTDKIKTLISTIELLVRQKLVQIAKQNHVIIAQTLLGFV